MGSMNNSNYKINLYRSVVGSLDVEVPSSRMIVHNHKTRPLIVLGNVSDPGRVTLLSSEPASVK